MFPLSLTLSQVSITTHHHIGRQEGKYRDITSLDKRVRLSTDVEFLSLYKRVIVGN